MAVMVLDETFVEGRSFLSALFRGHGLVELVSPSMAADDPKSKIPVNVNDLQELSISVNTLRRTLEQPQTIVHEYLPQVIVKHGADDVLKLINFWMTEIKRAGHLEFFLLPKRTFVDFEKKLLSIVDGAIEISVEKTKRGYDMFFLPIRLARNQFNMNPIKFVIEDGILVVKPSHRYVPGLVFEKLNKLLEKGEEVKLLFEEREDMGIPAKYYLFFRETSGWRLSWVREAFGDEFGNNIQLVGRLTEEGILKFVSSNVDEDILSGKKHEYGEKLRLVGSPGFVSFFSDILDYLKCRVDKEFEKRELIGCFNELYSRLYSYSVLRSERISFQELLKRVFDRAFSCKVGVRGRVHEGLFVEVKNCPICRSSFRVDDFHCRNVLGRVIAGAAKVFFQCRVDVSEVECGSTSNGRKCVFSVKVFS